MPADCVKTRAARASLLVSFLLLSAAPSMAQFVPGPNPIAGTVGAQTLAGGTGTINVGGAISIPSGGSVALTVTGTSTLNNNGIIQTLGSGRAIDSNSGIANLAVNNTGLISSVSTDAFRVNTDSAVSLVNSGTIRVTAGGQAIDWAAITTKSNMLTNQSTGLISAVGEDAVRPGTNGVVINAGTISATPTGGANPSGSDGIDVRTFTGISVTNTGLITGRSGIATDGSNAGPSTITVNNNSGGIIAAINGSGLNIDGVSTSVTANVTNQFGATIKGGVLAIATDGDGDGIDIDGVLTLNNSGDILALGAKGNGSDALPNGAQAVSIGGGTIINNATGRIIGSTLLADAPAGDPTRAGEGILSDNSSGGNAVAKTTVTNDGLIQGKSGAAIRFVSTFADSVTNNATGTIQGAGAAALGAAIQTGNGDNTLTNRGAIIGENGSAINLQGGNDTLNLYTGSSVVGAIDGGAGNDGLHLLGAGSGSLGSVSNIETLNVDAGHWAVNNAQSYSSGGAIAFGASLQVDHTSAAFGGSFIVSGTLASDPSILSFGDLNIDPTGLIQAGAGDQYKIGGNFNDHSTQNTQWDTSNAILEFTGIAGTSHNLLLTSTDLGFGGFVNDFAWRRLMIDAGNDLVLLAGSPNGTVFYVNQLIGAKISGDTITNIIGNGFDIYYDAAAPENAALLGRNYLLEGGGELIAAVPEPGTLVFLLSGLGVFVVLRRRKGARLAL
jgi:hypothetical protein